MYPENIRATLGEKEAQSMAKKSNPVTSKRVASKASKLLKSRKASKAVKSVAGAALSGARPRKSKKSR